MLFRSHDGYFWRNLLLVLTVICFAGVLITGFDPRSLFTGRHAIIGSVLLIAGGYFSALSIQEFAGIFFHMENKPWYAQRGGITFLTMALALINTLMYLVIAHIPQKATIEQAFPHSSLIFTALGLQLIWVVILDWPRGYPAAVHYTPSSPITFEDAPLPSDTYPPEQLDGPLESESLSGRLARNDLYYKEEVE